MMADYYKEQYEPLFLRLEKLLPFSAFPIRDLVQTIRTKHPITLKSKLTITNLHNSGDISGIVCTAGETKDKVFVCSLSHLIFEPSFLLYKEVMEYQRKRAKRIAQLNRM